MKFFIHAVIGNLATSLWFISPLSKWLHQLRGVKFTNRRSVFIGRDVVIDNRYPELLTLEEDVWLTRGVTILTHSYVSRHQSEILGMKETVKAVIIRRGAFIGAGSVILPGVEIGEMAYVAAGSIVNKNVEPRMLVAGNPIKPIRKLDGGKNANA